MRVWRGLSFRGLITIALIAGLISPAINSDHASAAQITERALTLQAGENDGGSLPGGNVNHLFTFTVPTSGSVGSIAFEYCTVASGTCTLPTGLVTTGSSLGSETGATGFSMVNTINGRPYITRAAASVPGTTELSYTLESVINPSTANETFFVRISTYTTTDASGTPLDEGVVAASTASEITLSGIMPESLIFCTGAEISVNVGGIPDCSTATSGMIQFNQLFSPGATAVATSQMAASTNASSGYSITVNGDTLKSGSNEITAITALAPSTIGIAQFGMNLVDNTMPDIGALVAPASNGIDLRAQPTADYAIPDNYKFVSGESVANSAYITPGPTNSQIYTASYIVNVPGSQPAGTYTSTLTYICTPTF